MSQMTALGADWWNDSGVASELAEAVALGAVGGTSNPVIVSKAAQDHPELCRPHLERLIREHPHATEDEIAWKLIHALGIESATHLQPVFEASNGEKGFLSMQVNPQFYPDPQRMVAQARQLAALAPNIAIKLPTTVAGIVAMEDLTAAGIRINATVSFSVAQAIAVSDAIERGLQRARSAGVSTDRLRPYITLMIGRVDDHLKRVAAAEGISAAEQAINWAGIAVFKRAHELFRSAGRPGTLLAAAYRHEGHWSQIIGPDVLQTIPYNWWRTFNDSGTTPTLTLDDPVDPAIVHELEQTFPDFVKAYDPAGMTPPEFLRFGATQHTLKQFLGGYADLLCIVREAMLN